MIKFLILKKLMMMKNSFWFMCAVVFSLMLTGCQQTATQNKSDAQLERASALEPADPLIDATQPVAKSADTTESCATLSQQQCLDSKTCIVDKAEKRGYVCRAAQGVCEQGFVQAHAKSQQVCLNNGKANNRQCFFRQASCFCPKGMTCICGGGLPAMCTDKPLVMNQSNKDDQPLY